MSRTGGLAREKRQVERNREPNREKMRRSQEKPEKKAMALHSERQSSPRKKDGVNARAVLLRCQTEQGSKAFWDAK